MRSKLLSESIKELKLNLHAPYPWQAKQQESDAFDVREMIKEWRREQRLKLVADAGPKYVMDVLSPGDSADLVDFVEE